MAGGQVDVIVLGAGVVGVSAALHLQARGRSVALVDRLDHAAGETSFGNTGVVQSEAVFPYVFPRAPMEILRAALNHDPRSHIRYGALPSVAPFLLRYFLASTAQKRLATAKAMAAFVGRAGIEHRAFAEAAGVETLLRASGWIKVFRSERGEAAIRAEIAELAPFGIRPMLLDRAALVKLEPHVGAAALGGVHFTEPMTTPDPQGLVQGYLRRFVASGGRFETGDARSLQKSGADWTVSTARGPLSARAVVVALGPWSDDVLRPLGIALPLGVKRGYHMHYRAADGAGVNRPVLDLERGYVVTPMARGLRLTTGAEFARRDDPPSPAHLERVEPFGREMFPLGERLDPAPWLGRRPCLPDMRPVIGPALGQPGLWLDFGHHHLGLTLGPVSGLLLAQMMCGETPFVDPATFRADRFA